MRRVGNADRVCQRNFNRPDLGKLPGNNNNLILRKLRIALNLKEEDMLAIFALRSFRLSAHELSAFFRNPSQAQYRECKDQVLRNFLMGLQQKFRPKED
jgi:uncharacterized protein YehS (DUF1456 family)